MAKDFNDPQIVEHYDAHIRKLIPGYELVHQQIQTLLALHLPDSAHILIVGCGTGHELIALAQVFPNWQFTAIDPAQHMIEKIEERLKNINLVNKISLICGDTTILSDLKIQFDAALSILVAHFVENKQQFYQDISQSLKKSAICISYDLLTFKQEKEQFRLKYLAELTGLHSKQSQIMLERFNDDFHLVNLSQLQQIYQNVGFQSSEVFCQIFNYYGLIAYQSD